MENGEMSNDPNDLDRLVKVFIRIRDQKAELARDFRAQEEALDAKLSLLEKEFNKHCEEHGVESVKTKSGTFYRSTRSKFWTSDWDAMNRFMLEHECVDLLEKRIHQGNMRQFLDENPEILPPGLNCDTEYKVTVRRKK